MATSGDAILVGIRVRPVLEEESGDHKLSVKEKTVKIHVSQSTYEFDHVFGPEVDTEVIYEAVADPIVKDVVKGINGTIFAYGQTASGKTFTMMGDGKESLGIIPLSVLKLFSIIRKQPEREFIVRVSFMELYNESITDLQDPSQTNLQIREVNGHVVVHGLTETTCSTVNDVLCVLVAAKDNRTVRETRMNATSSRSHTIFTIIIESKESAQDQDIVKVSYLHLVDLAGSEKASASIDAQGFKEGKYINLSLLTLGTVISKLSTTKGDKQHIPYRDSKLTRFLQSSLGGNARTVIICTVSPLVLEESESTLKFAQRAKKISNKPVVNEVFLSDEAKDRKIASLIEENTALKKLLNSKEKSVVPEREVSPVSSPPDQLQNKELFLDSPLFRNRRKTFVLRKDESYRSSFIPPHVTLRRRPSLNRTFELHDLPHIPDFSLEPTSTTDTSTQTDKENPLCVYDQMNESYLCEHLALYKSTRAKLEDSLFKYDELMVTQKEKESSMMNQISSLQSNIEVLTEQYKTVQNDMKTLTQEKEQTDQELRKMELESKAEVEAMLEQNEHLKTRLRKLEVKTNELEETKHILEAQLQQITSDYEAAIVRIQEKELTISTLEQECAGHQNALSENKEKLQQLDQTRAEEKAKYHEERVMLEDKLKELTTRFNSSAKTIESIVEENQALKNQIEELKCTPSGHEDVHSSMEIIVKENQALKKQIEELHSQHEKLLSTPSDHEDEEEAESFYSLRQEACLRLSEALALVQQISLPKTTVSSSSLTESYTAQIAVLNQHNEELEQKAQDFETCYWESQSKLQQLSDEMDVQDLTIVKLKTELSECQEEKSKKESELVDCQSKIISLQNEIDHTTSLQAASRYPSTVGPSQEQYERISTKARKLGREIEILKENNTKLSNERDNYRKERNVFRSKYEKLKSDVKNGTAVTGQSELHSSVHEKKKESWTAMATPEVHQRSMFFSAQPEPALSTIVDQKENSQPQEQLVTQTEEGPQKLFDWERSILEAANTNPYEFKNVESLSQKMRTNNPDCKQQ